jgi:beta-mannosidase
MRSTRIQVHAHICEQLAEGWEAASCPPEAVAGPYDARRLDWIPARVPGTAAGALQDAGRWSPGDTRDLDAEEWWFRTFFHAEPAAPGEELVLALDGIATVAEVYLNGEKLLDSHSMFAAHTVVLGEQLNARNELIIRCSSLGALLKVRRRPRARWRTRLVSEGGLRFFRTMLIGRASGFAPGPAAVGPWRPVRLIRRRLLAVEELTLRPRIEGRDGILAVSARLRALGTARPEVVEVVLEGFSGAHRATLRVADDPAGGPRGVLAAGELRVADVERWWPHTHGDPALHEVRLLVTGEGLSTEIGAGRVGFRELAPGPSEDHDIERDGLQVHVNGVAVFARGAVWTPADPVGLAPSEVQLRKRLTLVRDAGMNMLRIPGTAAYETGAFHDICDELGILVWQDLMFANMDYPFSEESFLATVQEEVRAVLADLGGRPSLAVVCGNSEIEQQVAMLGLEPSLGRAELFRSVLPAMLAEASVDAAYIPSAPCGGELPFRPDRGVANYYGVGSYRRDLEDARCAGVLFASECLAFSNVPDEEAIERMFGAGQREAAVHTPAWKAGVPRDAGAGWDFEDVRDHYLELLYGIDVMELRRIDQQRYLELSRTVTGEVMAEVFGEWRRAGSPCGGGLVLWLADLLPGAGWGLIDDRGEPKVAYHHLSRALAPVAVWTIDEGLGGVVAHVVNDLPGQLTGTLRIALYSGGETLVGEAETAVSIEPHGLAQWNVETVLGRFVDASWAYRFGPPAQDAIIVGLLAGPGHAREGELLSQAVRFPAGRRPLRREPPEGVGLGAAVTLLPGGSVLVELTSRRLAHGVRVHAPGFRASEECFTVEPGRTHRVILAAAGPGSHEPEMSVTALNMHGRIRAKLDS